MKHTHRLFILTLIVLIPILKLNGQNVDISGRIQGLSDSAILNIDFIPLDKAGDLVSRKLKIKNSEFSVALSILNPSVWYLVRIDCNEFYKTSAPIICDYGMHLDIHFYIQPGDKIQVEAKKVKYGVKYQLSGNSIVEQQNVIRNQIYELEQTYAGLINTKYSSKTNSVLDVEIENMKAKIDSINLENINKHPDWLYSAIMIQKYDPDIIQDVYCRFNEKVKRSFFGEYLVSHYGIVAK
jgi:hypothetical protein